MFECVGQYVNALNSMDDDHDHNHNDDDDDDNDDDDDDYAD